MDWWVYSMLLCRIIQNRNTHLTHALVESIARATDAFGSGGQQMTFSVDGTMMVALLVFIITVALAALITAIRTFIRPIAHFGKINAIHFVRA